MLLRMPRAETSPPRRARRQGIAQKTQRIGQCHQPARLGSWLTRAQWRGAHQAGHSVARLPWTTSMDCAPACSMMLPEAPSPSFRCAARDMPPPPSTVLRGLRRFRTRSPRLQGSWGPSSGRSPAQLTCACHTRRASERESTAKPAGVAESPTTPGQRATRPVKPMPRAKATKSNTRQRIGKIGPKHRVFRNCKDREFLEDRATRPLKSSLAVLTKSRNGILPADWKPLNQASAQAPAHPWRSLHTCSQRHS